MKAVLALLAVVALLLAVLIIDRWREPQQMKAVHDSVERLTLAVERQTEALKRLQVAGPAAPAVAPVTTGDGLPCLGRNFLAAPPTGLFHPDRVRGNLRWFEIPPNGLNNVLQSEYACDLANTLVNDSVADLDPADPRRRIQGLAVSMVVSDDWRRYDITLRPGVVWQRPAIASQPANAWLDRDVPMTAKDIAFQVEMIRHPEVQCPHLKGYYDDLDRVEVHDDLHFSVVWKKSLFKNLSATSSMFPLPRHVYTANADGSPMPADQVPVAFNKHWFDQAKQLIGVGPCRVERYEPGKTMSFVRNPSFWGETLHFERLEWDGETVQPDAQLVAFKNGQVQWWDSLPPQFYRSQIMDGGEPRWDRKQGRAGAFGWERVVGLTGRTIYSYIGWNLRRPQFADRSTRWALAYAFDKKRIIAEAYHGLGQSAVGPVSRLNPDFNTDLVDPAFDLDRAKALLAEAGWADHDQDGWLDRTVEGKVVPLRFKVTYYGPHPVWPKVLAIYRDDLKRIGVDLQPAPAEPSEMDRQGDDKDFDAMINGWVSPIESDFDQIWHSRYAQEAKSSNFVGFADPEVDRLSDELRQTFDTAKRIDLSRRIQARIFDQQPYLFAFDREFVFVWNNQALDGVTEGLDRWHRLYSRKMATWYRRN